MYCITRYRVESGLGDIGLSCMGWGTAAGFDFGVEDTADTEFFRASQASRKKRDLESGGSDERSRLWNALPETR